MAPPKPKLKLPAIACRERLDNTLFAEIAVLAITVEYRIDEGGIELRENLSDENGFVRVVAITIIGDRNSRGIAPNIYSPDDASR